MKLSFLIIAAAVFIFCSCDSQKNSNKTASKSHVEQGTSETKSEEQLKVEHLARKLDAIFKIKKYDDLPKNHHEFEDLANEFANTLKDMKLSDEESFRWMLNIAEDGNIFAQSTVANAYMHGLGVTKNEKQAFDRYLKIAENEGVFAYEDVADAYNYGRGVDIDTDKAMIWYEKKANFGWPGAQRKLAWLYDKKENYTEALNWHLKAANAGDRVSQSMLGDIYAEGKGTHKDLIKAAEWYEKTLTSYEIAFPLIESKLRSTYFNLGLNSSNGEGAPKDLTEAVKWYQKAADMGDASAQNNLGLLYFNGEGVTRDLAVAVKLFRQAAEQGSSVAQYNLGLRYSNGEGVPKDLTEAVKWYQKAAEQGSSSSQFTLGLCYSNGKGVLKDLTISYMWFNICAANQNNDAEDARNMLEEIMTPEQISEAQKMSREWVEKHKKE